MVDSRPRLHGGRLFAGMEMGPRIREDNGRGRGRIGRELGRKMDCRPRLHEGRFCATEWGWVPASARTTGGGAGVVNGR